MSRDASFWDGAFGYAVSPVKCDELTLKPYHPQEPFKEGKYPARITKTDDDVDVFILILSGPDWSNEIKGHASRLRFLPKNSFEYLEATTSGNSFVYQDHYLKKWKIEAIKDGSKDIFIDTLSWARTSDGSGRVVVTTSWRWKRN
jgi:hypothetical protein